MAQTPQHAAAAQQIDDSILDAVGRTPLVRLARLAAGLTPQVVAKVEYLNPGGSIKDRVAVAMIDAAERDGLLKPGGTLVEPTSGNTGTGLAIAARLKGYRVIAVMPDKQSKEKMDLLRAYGAEVVVTPTEVDPDSEESYYKVAERLASEIPGAFRPNQYSNKANPQAHYDTTGPEIWEQTGGAITHLVVGVGTGGTITGCGRYLKERNPAIEIIGADPAGSIYTAGPEGPKGYVLEGVGEDFWPDTFDPSIVDRYVTVSDRDAFLMTRRLAQKEGLLTGGSCGLACVAALEIARGIDDPDALLVVILPDGGRSYLSKIYNDAWMEQYGYIDRATITVADVLARKQADSDIPPLVTVGAHDKVAEAIALLNKHRVSQLPVVSAHDSSAVIGSISERGLLKHVVEDPALLGSRVVDMMSAPFPAVAASDLIQEAVALLAGDREALLVTLDGRASGILTRADLLEALAR
ncbi:MAG: cystathionine beta-synthase [Solirubrobacterales bacterium]|nr:cystathionine beta-synthase [Solirubrobacterales bacterium]